MIECYSTLDIKNGRIDNGSGKLNNCFRCISKRSVVDAHMYVYSCIFFYCSWSLRVRTERRQDISPSSCPHIILTYHNSQFSCTVKDFSYGVFDFRTIFSFFRSFFFCFFFFSFLICVISSNEIRAVTLTMQTGTTLRPNTFFS